MTIIVGNVITIFSPSDEVVSYCLRNLVFENPEYEKKRRMGFWTGNVPKKIFLYQRSIGTSWIVPYGCKDDILSMVAESDTVFEDFGDRSETDVDFGAEVELYNYQQRAVINMYLSGYGILQAPAGSGKTQMGLALAALTGKRTLWITHTKDLLTQSKQRAERYMDSSLIGTITDGKIEIGEAITFATIQTLARIDVTPYDHIWDTVIVDECHRAAGSPTTVTQFSKVLNSLYARHKFGLSATVHRADGLIGTTFALLGEVRHVVSDEDVSGTTVKASIVPRFTGIKSSYECQNTDGTLNFNATINYLTGDDERNDFIAADILSQEGHSMLVLSHRVEHLHRLVKFLPADLQEECAVISGTTKKSVRENVLEKMRNGELQILFATYNLAKEGLDIPRLDRLFLVTPQKDFAIVTQSVGRIERSFSGKDFPKVYDYVDHIRTFEKWYKERCRTYRKIGCEVLKDD